MVIVYKKTEKVVMTQLYYENKVFLNIVNSQ